MNLYDFVKEQYKERFEYDLALALLSDGLTDDLYTVIEICKEYFDSVDIDEILSAWNMFKCLPKMTH